MPLVLKNKLNGKEALNACENPYLFASYAIPIFSQPVMKGCCNLQEKTCQEHPYVALHHFTRYSVLHNEFPELEQNYSKVLHGRSDDFSLCVIRSVMHHTPHMCLSVIQKCTNKRPCHITRSGRFRQRILSKLRVILRVVRRSWTISNSLTE